MATTYSNIQMSVVDASGNVNVIYPQTLASLVTTNPSTTGLSSTSTTVEKALTELNSNCNILNENLCKIIKPHVFITNSEHKITFKPDVTEMSMTRGTLFVVSTYSILVFYVTKDTNILNSITLRYIIGSYKTYESSTISDNGEVSIIVTTDWNTPGFYILV